MSWTTYSTRATVRRSATGTISGTRRNRSTRGYGPHAEWLERFAGKMIGVHLHDIIGMEDHLAAGEGTMSWDLVAQHLPPHILRTCEFRNANSPEQVAGGLRWLADKGLISET